MEKITYKIASKLRNKGFTYKEIAQKLGCSINTVGVCLRMGSYREQKKKEKKMARINEKIKLAIAKGL